MQTPTVGRIVHYHRDTADKSVTAAEPAIITKVIGDGVVNLVIFSADPGDAPAWALFKVNNSEFAAPGCWSWPPRV